MNKFTVTVQRKDKAFSKVVDKDSFTIGRSLECDISINETAVSRVHLMVSRRWNQVWIVDKNSSNGVFVNGTKIVQDTPVNVVKTDKIQLGKAELYLFIDLETDEVEPEVQSVSAVMPDYQVPVPQPVPQAQQVQKPVQQYETVPPQQVPSAVLKTRETPAAKSQSVNYQSVQPSNAVPQAPKAPEPAAAPAAEENSYNKAQAEKGAFEAEKVIHEAKRKAAQIIFESESQAERRVQAIYQKARELQAEAEHFHQTRIAEAHKEADAILADYQRQGHALLHDARAMAQELREEVDVYVKNLRDKARLDVEDKISEAAIQAEKMKEAAVETARANSIQESEARMKNAEEEAARTVEFAQKQVDSIKEKIVENQKQLVSSTEAAEDAQVRLESLQNRLKEADQSLLNLLEQEKAIKARIQGEENKGKENLEAEEYKLKAIQKNITDALADQKKQQESLQKLQEHQAKLTMDLNELEAKKKHMLQEYEGQKVHLNEKIEKEKSQILKTEEQRLEDMRIQQSKELKKIEQAMLDDLINKRTQMAKEIHTHVEQEVVKVLDASQWRNISANVEKLIQDTFEGRLANMSSSVSSNAKPINVTKKRKNEKLRWVAVSLAMGALLHFGGQIAYKRLAEDQSPLQSIAQDEAKARAADLERRRFNPAQVDEVKETYTDSVIYKIGRAHV